MSFLVRNDSEKSKKYKMFTKKSKNFLSKVFSKNFIFIDFFK